MLGAADIGQIVRCIREADGNGYASREELCAHIQLALPWRERPDVRELVEFWRERFPRCSVEREGATATLRGLRDRGVKRGLITNGQPTQRVKVDAMGLGELLEVMVISEEVGMKKPDPRIFRMTLDRLGVDASEAVFVGDNLELDIAGARGVGMRALWLNPDGKEVPPGVEMVGSLGEILGMIGRIGAS